MQQRFAAPREFGAQGRDGVPLDGRAPRETDVLEFADGGARAVAADQVTPAPPGALGAPGVCRDARRVLFDAVQPALHRHLHQRLPGERRPQDAGQDVLGEVQGSGSGGLGTAGLGGILGRATPRVLDAPERAAVPAPEPAVERAPVSAVGRLLARALEHHPPHHLLPPHRPPAAPADARPGERRAGQAFDERGGVLAQHGGAGEPGFVLARAVVEDHGGDLLAGQRECQGQPHGPCADDDHRVHGAAPPAHDEVLGNGREQAGGAGCTITERMQPIAAVRVKRRTRP